MAFSCKMKVRSSNNKNIIAETNIHFLVNDLTLINYANTFLEFYQLHWFWNQKVVLMLCLFAMKFSHYLYNVCGVDTDL